MTSFEEARKIVLNFDKERNWSAHPEDFAKSIILEAAELLEHFQWDSTRKERGTLKQKEWEEIKNEVADIACYLIKFCHCVNIDLPQAIINKTKLAALKYPIKKGTL